MTKHSARKVLEEFLSFPVCSAAPVLRKFAELDGAVSCIRDGKENFVYVPGTREDRIVLAAHADAYWDTLYAWDTVQHSVKKTREGYVSGVPDRGFGADDRAGCAMLWLLRNSGHSLLVLDGEEHGQRGAHAIRESCPALFSEINSHNYIIQLDRRGSSDYKFYYLPVTDEFRDFVRNSTGYSDAGMNSRTDIVVLCDKICGVNLSVGYYNEHKPEEKLVFDEWFNTLKIVEKMIKGPQKRFELLNEE